MPRATSKGDLIKSANEQFDKMWQLIDSLSRQQQLATFNFDGKFLSKEAYWSRDRTFGMFLFTYMVASAFIVLGIK